MSAVFAADGDAFVPTGHAVGPWDPNSLHGGAPAALIARAVERLEAPGPMLLARLTVEFLGAVPLAPLRVEAQIVRPGRRLQLAEATLTAGEKVVCRARAVRLREEPVDVPQRAVPAPRIPRPAGEPWRPDPPPHGGTEGFGQTAMELRFAAGHFAERGPATAWFRLGLPLVEGEETTPTQQAVAAADFGNGLAAELSWAEHLFVNTDLTVHLSRAPAPGPIALESVTEHGPLGTALAASVLHDEHGPVGRSAQTLFVATR